MTENVQNIFIACTIINTGLVLLCCAVFILLCLAVIFFIKKTAKALVPGLENISTHLEIITKRLAEESGAYKSISERLAWNLNKTVDLYEKDLLPAIGKVSAIFRILSGWLRKK
ncbi:MAG: hypothetical protein A2096_10900 [Spirochaetes bacterium GWF1_41_5]|nr:MAG: hypothetical protein A2096_10900 [Spirochaetes bacterium GWF1_41_5]HBE01668.1 hypothetical protein [Spirochaetia bacterium]